MLTQELHWFRENIAAPRMQQLLRNTTIPDGYCCIKEKPQSSDGHDMR